MNKVDVYNSDYTKLNHSYIVMYETYEKLIQCEDADEEAMFNYDKPAFELDDYSEFKDFESELTEEDEKYLASLLDKEDE